MIFASLAVVSGLVAGELGPGVDRGGGDGGAVGEERFVYRRGKACVVYVAAESSVGDPLMAVLEGRGNVVSEDEDGGGGTTASVGFRAQEGEYTVIVSAVPTGTVGSVEVWLREVPLVPPERREEFEAAVARREEAERLYAEERLPEAREA